LVSFLSAVIPSPPLTVFSAGLVGITPAAGFVSPWIAALIGFLTSVCCALVQDVNKWIGIDEGMDVFKLHGIGGMIGSILTGIFAQSWVSALDGATQAPGGIDGNGVQVGKQFAEITSISAYSFVVTCILLYILKYIPYMHLRVSDEAEMVGLDIDQFFDEQIGDWSMFEQHPLTGYTEGKSAPVSSAPSVKHTDEPVLIKE
jgi:Amt family ammonium transporter